jgi:hypothetical protein
MKKPSRLQLHRETISHLKMRTGLKTGLYPKTFICSDAFCPSRDGSLCASACGGSDAACCA